MLRIRSPHASPLSARIARPALVVALVAAASGCRAAVDRAFQQPTLTFTGATLRGVGLDGGTIDVTATVRNANPYPLRAQRARYTLLTADSAEIGHGETTEVLAVGARDSATLLLPVHVPLAGLVQAGVGAVAGAASTGTAGYRVIGEVVLVSTPVGDVRVPIDVRGRARLAR